MKTRAAVIIPAAGSGTRMKSGTPKQYMRLSGKPILVHTIKPFRLCSFITQIIVVVPAERLTETQNLLKRHNLAGSGLSVVAGGKRRQDSVQEGMKAVRDDIDIILVHDGARPCVSVDLIERCYSAIADSGAAIAAIPVKDTLKRAGSDRQIEATIERDALWQAQTPQGAKRELLDKAFQLDPNLEATDESSLLERAGIPVQLVSGEETNIKITRQEDIMLAEAIMNQSIPLPRIGHGFDAHRFSENRRLVLGGVDIDYHLGLAGHSDADVVSHALCDAILGAAGLGDIGRHFPDSDAAFKDINSLRLLEEVIKKAETLGFRPVNADITIICQAPKLAPYIKEMEKNLAYCCGVEPNMINIKATTTEKMGYTGREEGISCHAVTLLEKAQSNRGQS